MTKLEVSAFDIAQRFVGIKGINGKVANPQVIAMLQLEDPNLEEEVAWCSAFVNYVCWLLRLPRSKSLAARSWLTIGTVSPRPEVGFDVVIIKRDGPNEPGPEVINALGHVGFFAGYEKENVLILGGNQSDMVNVSSFPVTRVLGIRSVGG